MNNKEKNEKDITENEIENKEIENPFEETEKSEKIEWDWRDDMIDEMQHYYSFGALRLDREYTGLKVDVFLCQNEEYLLETGKFKVFFKVNDNHTYGSEGYGIIENGDFYMKDFDKCTLHNHDIDDIIRFVYNNNFYLQLLVFDGSAIRWDKFIKGYNYISDEKTLYNQLEAGKERLTSAGIVPKQMSKWWNRSSRLNTGIDAEFCHNLMKRIHRLYYSELRYGQFMFIFDSWFRDMYDRDYFSVPDMEMPRVINTFVGYSNGADPIYRNGSIAKPSKELIEFIIDLIPSLTLRRVYKEEIKKGKIPNWRYFDLVTLIINTLFDYDKRLEYLKIVMEELDNMGVDKYEKLYEDLKKLINKHIETGELCDDSNFKSYIPTRVLYKGGELVKYKTKQETLYGMVYPFDYNRVLIDITDNCYNCLILDPENIDINNEEDILGCHEHPSMFMVEDADESELTDKQLEYLKFLRKKYVKNEGWNSYRV